MKLAIVFLVCVISRGCGTEPQKPTKESPAVRTVAVSAASSPTPALTDKQKISLLRAEAHKRGLRWTVTCMDYEQPEEQFFAAAEDKRDPERGQFIEDGALPWWYANGQTQPDAAYALYLAIQEPPNQYPAHKPREEKHTHKICPPQLRGE